MRDSGRLGRGKLGREGIRKTSNKEGNEGLRERKRDSEAERSIDEDEGERAKENHRGMERERL